MCIEKLQIKITIEMRSFLIYLINNVSFCLYACMYFAIYFVISVFYKYKNIIFISQTGSANKRVDIFTSVHLNQFSSARLPYI